MRILVADDDRVLGKLLEGAFHERGWEVIPAYDAMQAIMMAKREPMPELIVLDVSMPGGTGIHALERIKASARTAFIPIIVISALKDQNLPERVVALGAAAFLQKPIDPEELARLVEQHRIRTEPGP